jgi:hypothetical protein
MEWFEHFALTCSRCGLDDKWQRFAALNGSITLYPATEPPSVSPSLIHPENQP